MKALAIIGDMCSITALLSCKGFAGCQICATQQGRSKLVVERKEHRSSSFQCLELSLWLAGFTQEG